MKQKLPVQFRADEALEAMIEKERARLRDILGSDVTQAQASVSLIRRGAAAPAPVVVTPAPPAVAPVEPVYATPAPPAVAPKTEAPTAAAVLAALEASTESQRAIAERGGFNVGNFHKLKKGESVSTDMLLRMWTAIHTH